MQTPVVRVVFDTNILYAAIAQPNGHLAEWVFNKDNDKYRVYVSPAIIHELKTVIERNTDLTRDQVLIILQSIQLQCTMIEPRTRIVEAPDPDDNIILECALEAKAEMIFTADRQFMKMKDFRGIKLVHPSSLEYSFYF
jgi:uncharacterized protein